MSTAAGYSPAGPGESGAIIPLSMRGADALAARQALEEELEVIVGEREQSLIEADSDDVKADPALWRRCRTMLVLNGGIQEAVLSLRQLLDQVLADGRLNTEVAWEIRRCAQKHARDDPSDAAFASLVKRLEGRAVADVGEASSISADESEDRAMEKLKLDDENVRFMTDADPPASYPACALICSLAVSSLSLRAQRRRQMVSGLDLYTSILCETVARLSAGSDAGSPPGSRLARLSKSLTPPRAPQRGSLRRDPAPAAAGGGAGAASHRSPPKSRVAGDGQSTTRLIPNNPELPSWCIPGAEDAFRKRHASAADDAAEAAAAAAPAVTTVQHKEGHAAAANVAAAASGIAGGRSAQAMLVDDWESIPAIGVAINAVLTALLRHLQSIRSQAKLTALDIIAVRISMCLILVLSHSTESLFLRVPPPSLSSFPRLRNASHCLRMPTHSRSRLRDCRPAAGSLSTLASGTALQRRWRSRCFPRRPFTALRSTPRSSSPAPCTRARSTPLSRRPCEDRSQRERMVRVPSLTRLLPLPGLRSIARPASRLTTAPAARV